MNPPTGIILAGGRSRRMGKNKALLPLPGNHPQTFIEYLVAAIAPYCAEVLVVARDQAQVANYTFLPPARVVFDDIPDYGPLMGIKSGLRVTHASSALVTAVDMPCVRPAVLAFLLNHYRENTLLVPLVHAVPQVLLAIYPRSILPLIETCIQQGRRDPRCLLDIAPVQYIEEAQLREVDPELRSFIGVNTPEELQSLL